MAILSRGKVRLEIRIPCSPVKGTAALVGAGRGLDVSFPGKRPGAAEAVLGIDQRNWPARAVVARCPVGVVLGNPRGDVLGDAGVEGVAAAAHAIVRPIGGAAAQERA